MSGVQAVRWALPATMAIGLWLAPAAAPSAQDRVVYRETGTASFYGHELAGQKTASGERYDPAALTAAHPTLPLGARVTVVALASGRSVTVEVNDRGPFTGGRMIDLSLRAAQALGIVKSGVARVRISATREQLQPRESDAD